VDREPLESKSSIITLSVSQRIKPGLQAEKANMTTRKLLMTVAGILIVGILVQCGAQVARRAEETARFKPNWRSLSQWEVPQWFQDAVLGIYCHWGVYSVPGYRFNDGAEQVDSGLWYGAFMYVPNDSEQPNYGVWDHHWETYGDPLEFGYHELVPMFTAENWDPQAWITLYKEAGADFAGLAAEHGDGFIMWDSEFDAYNAMYIGPKRDLLGELFEAARAQGLKTIATFHEPPGEMFESGRYYCPPGVGVNDPQYADLYATSSFNVLNKKLLEVVDKYKPDQIWVEDAYCGEENWKEFIAYYYNKGDEWGKEVLISQKHDLAPLSCSVFDIEGGIFPGGVWEWAGMTEPQEQRWQKDVPIGNYWAYAEGVGCRPVNMLVDGIVDRVSKNGVTLLDVAPKADGTLPEAQIAGLKELGQWMAVNREALYAADCAPFTEGGVDTWRAGSIRFTEKGEYLYAIDLGNEWPPTVGFADYGDSKEPEAPLHIPGIHPVKNSEIRMLGSSMILPWHLEGDNLVIEAIPDSLPCEHAWSFKIKVLHESK
jgi:alpha-L-fucosidase